MVGEGEECKNHISVSSLSKMLLPVHLHIVYGNHKQADLSGYLKYLLSDPLWKKQYANFCSKIILNN